MGVAALTRLITLAGGAMSDDVWTQCMTTLSSAAVDTMPQVRAPAPPHPPPARRRALNF